MPSDILASLCPSKVSGHSVADAVDRSSEAGRSPDSRDKALFARLRRGLYTGVATLHGGLLPTVDLDGEYRQCVQRAGELDTIWVMRQDAIGRHAPARRGSCFPAISLGLGSKRLTPDWGLCRLCFGEAGWGLLPSRRSRWSGKRLCSNPHWRGSNEAKKRPRWGSNPRFPADPNEALEDETRDSSSETDAVPLGHEVILLCCSTPLWRTN